MSANVVVSIMPRHELQVHLLSCHHPSPLTYTNGYQWHVNRGSTWTKIRTSSTIGYLKSKMAKWYQIPPDEQHWYHTKLTISQTKSIKELDDTITIGSLSVKEFSVIIEPSQSLTHSYLKKLLPHISEIDRQELLTRLKLIPLNSLDVTSIRETSMIPPKLMDLTIRLYPSGIIVDHIMMDDELFFPHQIDPKSNLVILRRKYSYQYSAASDEYIMEKKKVNEKYESDLAHCKKLLHDLPIALVNSQKRLAEETKAVRENVSGLELSDLGALNIEQSVIGDEIKAQQERLLSLKFVPFEKSKFTVHRFQSQIELSFGWHKFNEIVYELIRPPTVSEINRLIQLNQRSVSVKRTRQQFESGQAD